MITCCDWYGGEAAVRQLLTFHANGPAAWVWYLMLICNVAIPWLTLWNKKIRRTPWLMFIITMLINVGMYCRTLHDHPADPGAPALAV